MSRDTALKLLGLVDRAEAVGRYDVHARPADVHLVCLAAEVRP